MAEVSNAPEEKMGTGLSTAPLTTQQPLRSVLKRPPAPPPEHAKVPHSAQAVSGPMQAAFDVATNAASTTAYAAATMARVATLGVFNPKGPSEQDEPQPRHSRHGRQEAGDGRQSQPAATNEMRSSSTTSSSNSKLKKHKVKRALGLTGNPMMGICTLLLVVCSLLLVGVVGYMLFWQPPRRGGGAAALGKRRSTVPNITADAFDTTFDRWWTPPQPSANTTGTASTHSIPSAGARNSTD